jgi:hypothetical protein
MSKEMREQIDKVLKWKKFLNENTNKQALPIRKINKLFHVGNMNINDKSNFSLEGSGLSVSVNPKEWRKIAQLGDKDLYILTNPNGVFVDGNKLNKQQKNNVIGWGVENGYIIQEETYRVYYYDDELEQKVYMEFSTYKEAERQAADVNDIKIYKAGIKPTEKLKIETKQNKIDISQAFDLLLTLYVENETNYDGIWWNDKLDVSKYSAPRGVIFNSKLNNWLISKQ